MHVASFCNENDSKHAKLADRIFGYVFTKNHKEIIPYTSFVVGEGFSEFSPWITYHPPDLTSKILSVPGHSCAYEYNQI